MKEDWALVKWWLNSDCFLAIIQGLHNRWIIIDIMHNFISKYIIWFLVQDLDKFLFADFDKTFLILDIEIFQIKSIHYHENWLNSLLLKIFLTKLKILKHWGKTRKVSEKKWSICRFFQVYQTMSWINLFWILIFVEGIESSIFIWIFKIIFIKILKLRYHFSKQS